ncbi:MAG TPA: ankyrin repeat domain-containing protein [Candidatus Sulfotelmatobacter sp.]|nr:ankyrin repeat domain-containing protein [Candidatus Sulfotelmatobacter sp.]
MRADAQNPGQKPVLTPAVQEHLKEIAESLPPDSVVRYGLEHGGHGDGVRLPWMDEMRQMGIKRVVVQTEFLWHRRPKDAKAIYFVYSSTYDGDCGQIVDSQRLAKIRSSGLEAELGGEAVRRTFEVPWLRGKPRRVKHGFGIFTFLNDPWMPVVPRLGYLVSAPKRPVDPFLVAVDMGDVAAVKQFLREGVTAEERDEAVWALVAPTGTSCTLKALLQAGADPNMRDSYGSPLLMEEIRRGNVENAQVLVEAGADVNAKNHYGYTILSMAEAKPGFSGQDELVRLLKAAGARK